MTLQNRVTPLGEIVADPARGTLMGNRGILHDDKRRLGTSRWKHKAWIACTLQFKERRRKLMAPGRYTELFFLDEATSLAAGHRPCAECRRADFNAFRAAWVTANGSDDRPTAVAMDAALHTARVDRRSRAQIRHERPAADLPDGIFVLVEAEPWLVWRGRLRRWTFGGYDATAPIPPGVVTVITPAPTVASLAAGYLPAVHASVAGAH
ncbi:hypothetical protein GTW51_11390 [Aurantimonas aggregata]|uniref:Uncharacterized protein n=1 Tax=Aurantimonas aggregata TaxID=2047720 RepID=A0A6L9MHH1_9HYPH|nr:hypothetical protein [Aurantimonas aggregata]NDV87303.1 hypothetical protein [Aurantimonas aggregata]